MPVVLRSDGYIFFFYSNEGDPREPIHIHVRKGGAEAKIWLEPSVALAESNGFNSRELSVIIRLALESEAKIKRAWHDHFGNERSL
ncbi:DUF4160 domain-containing protein [Rhizobium cremeum]|uniref:DUF4160 domain-containing protein n=1 Tax=Rhizobium cremeum TaxID=2813827 RepID=UPI000DD7F46E|nr:DUF4160 domain-containing protein [Rhizobium cremeum]MCJ7993606.1 DUF4160 domain-containing protein [Rhizobium cremeum]MCJ7998663.1 DUF4160 domain-containing protein [Rhizobium cremeum]